jgi:hypothetical protein
MIALSGVFCQGISNGFTHRLMDFFVTVKSIC